MTHLLLKHYFCLKSSVLKNLGSFYFVFIYLFVYCFLVSAFQVFFQQLTLKVYSTLVFTKKNGTKLQILLLFTHYN